MIAILLESIARSRPYDDLPETWQVPEIGCFSALKTLYDYQADALKNAWRPSELSEAGSQRKQHCVTLIKPCLWRGEGY